MRFKPGQQVVCIKKGKWSYNSTNVPKYGDIVTVLRRCDVIPDGALVLKEFECDQFGNIQSFVDYRFAPLMDISELTEILEHQPAEL